MKQELTINDVLKIIAEEASNGCYDARSTVAYFERHFTRTHHTERVNLDLVEKLVNVIDFKKLREEANPLLYALLKDHEKHASEIPYNEAAKFFRENDKLEVLKQGTVGHTIAVCAVHAALNNKR